MSGLVPELLAVWPASGPREGDLGMRVHSILSKFVLLSGLLLVASLQAAPPRKVAALGRLEPRGGMIAITAPPGERIEQLPLAIGSRVEAGDELAILSGHKARLLQLELARQQREEASDRALANIAAARAIHEEALLGVEAVESTDAERVAQEARHRVAVLALETARVELDRLSGLEPRLVPSQSLERKRLLVRQGEIDAEAQRTLLERMEATAELRRRSAGSKLRSAAANIAVAESSARLDSLEKGVEIAKMSVELARVRAPSNGRIIEIVSRVGELTGLRPILRLADTDHMQVVAEVYETDIRQVQVGQEVVVNADVLGGQSLHGRVVEIGTVIGANEVQGLGMAPTAEERIIKVWIDLDDSAIAASLINLQVNVGFYPINASQDRAVP